MIDETTIENEEHCLFIRKKNVLSIDEEKGGLFIAMFDPKRFASLMVCNRKNMKRKVQGFFIYYGCVPLKYKKLQQ